MMERVPSHIMLLNADWHWRTLFRWLIGHWYYGSSGLACWIADAGDTDFWTRMLAASHPGSSSPLGTIWPRSEERKRFRGKKAIAAIGEQQYIFGDEPTDLVRVFINGAPNYRDIEHRVLFQQSLSPATAYIVCKDLAELELAPVDFPSGLPWIYPRETVSDLRAELEPWTAHCKLAAELIQALGEEPHV